MSPHIDVTSAAGGIAIFDVIGGGAFTYPADDVQKVAIATSLNQSPLAG